MSWDKVALTGSSAIWSRFAEDPAETRLTLAVARSTCHSVVSFLPIAQIAGHARDRH